MAASPKPLTPLAERLNIAAEARANEGLTGRYRIPGSFEDRRVSIRRR